MNKKPTKERIITIRVEPELGRRFESMAESRGMTVSAWLRWVGKQSLEIGGKK